MLIGYGRVSTVDQDLSAQIEQLGRLGVDQERVYVDHGLSGRNRDRPGLREALAACREGDQLVVTKLDRLARSVPDAIDILRGLETRGVALNIGGAVHDLRDPFGKMFIQIMIVVAEFEADLTRLRTREGMAVAKARGRLRGKQPKLTPKQQRHVIELWEAGDKTPGEIAEFFQVSRTTIRRIIDKHKAAAADVGSQ